MALPLLALAGALLGRFLGGPRWFKPLFLLGLMVLASHLLLDLATSYGTQILSPFSRRRFSLDWVFIIDPYLTALLLAGAISALAFHRWGPRLGTWFLAAALVYMLVCAFYHHQALALARQALQTTNPPEQTVAALPQPFSCRRWQLIAARPGEIRQAFVQLPFAAAWEKTLRVGEAKTVMVPRGQECLAPTVAYQAPDHLTIQIWTPVAAAGAYPRETAKNFVQLSGICPVSLALPGGVSRGRTTAGVAGPALFRPRTQLSLRPATAPGRPRPAPALAHRIPRLGSSRLGARFWIAKRKAL